MTPFLLIKSNTQSGIFVKVFPDVLSKNWYLEKNKIQKMAKDHYRANMKFFLILSGIRLLRIHGRSFPGMITPFSRQFC